MKSFLVVIGLVFSLFCTGQTDSILNETLEVKEYEFLNSNLNKEKYSYDFKDKKVAFFSSPGGTILHSKKNFFQTENDKVIGYEYFDIVIFTDKQKSKHKYDVAVIYGSKNTQPRISNKLKRIVKKNN